jgi:hypothetical protein
MRRKLLAPQSSLAAEAMSNQIEVVTMFENLTELSELKLRPPKNLLLAREVRPVASVEASVARYERRRASPAGLSSNPRVILVC